MKIESISKLCGIELRKGLFTKQINKGHSFEVWLLHSSQKHQWDFINAIPPIGFF